jgi:hypothetical protein
LGANSTTSGYLKLTSDQAIHAWASKIDNGTDDPASKLRLVNPPWSLDRAC